MLTALMLAGTVLAGAPAVAPVSAAPRVVDSWLPWLGCWRLVDDDVREPLSGDSTALGEEPLPRRGLVCVSPSPDGAGVTVTTSDGGDAVFEEALVANGERMPSSKGECVGWQQTNFSSDGRRLFTRAELTCEEDRKLAVSGLSLIVAPANWVEIQVVDGGGARAVVVRRYRPVRSASVEEGDEPLLSPELVDRARRARYDAAEVLSVDDVLEVIDRTEPEVVEAAVLEMKDEGFDLDAKNLERLEDAGARSGLIDLMVALSYPDYFLVDREPEPGLGNALPGPYGYGGPSATLAYPYYLAPFGGYYWYAPYHPVYVLGGPVGGRSYEVGRVVKGQGYTRVNRQSPATGFFGRSGSGSVGSSSGGSSSGGGASPGGYSSGGGGTRHAKPRPK